MDNSTDKFQGCLELKIHVNINDNMFAKAEKGEIQSKQCHQMKENSIEFLKPFDINLTKEIARNDNSFN